MKRSLPLVLALSFATAIVAHAQVLTETRTMGVVFRQGVPHLYYSARDLFSPKLKKKLQSGLPQRIVVQHFVYSPARVEPLAVDAHACRVVYDLWQTIYRVELEHGAAGTVFETYVREQDVLERCLVVRNRPIGVSANYRGAARAWVASLVELNPLSEATVARIRRWLSRPSGGGSLENNAFFGSFVSLFVNQRIGSAERTLKLRSQTFEIR